MAAKPQRSTSARIFARTSAGSASVAVIEAWASTLRSMRNTTSRSPSVFSPRALCGERAFDRGAIDDYGTAPRPGPVISPVRIRPSVMRKMPGKRSAQGAFAAGQYCRAFDSMAVTPGTCAANPAE